MAISPRSLSHALRLELRSPRVRASRTPEGGRVLAFDPPETVRPQEPNAAEQMPTPTPDPLVPRAEGFSGRVGERFIDDPTEVGFRAGLLRSARENYDFYAADRPDELQRFGPVEPVRLADGTERPALKLTPDVRARIAGGETPAQFDQRPRFMFGAGDGGDLNGQFRVDSEGRVFALPFRDRWGDPRFNPEDRAHAMAALQEIADRGPRYWRDAPWEQVVAAHDAIDEILAQLPSYNRDYLSAEAEATRIRIWGDAETARRRGFGGDMHEYYRYQQGMAPYGEGWGGALIPHQPEYARVPRRAPVPDDVVDIVSTARAAADALLRSRRRGLRDLIQWDRRADPDVKAGGPGAKRGRPPARMPLDRNARFSAVRRAAEALGDEWFVDPETGRGGRPGSQVLGALRKARNVTQAEIDHTELFSLLGRRDAPLTREQLLAWIDDRALLLQLRTAEFDPARPTRDYQDMGGTRSFNGPRVPGYGRYFEREYKFPPRVGRRGEAVEAADWAHPHSNHEGVMSSVRGSVRDVPKLGKGVLAEEVQFDFYQQEVTGRVKVEPDPIKRGQVVRQRQDLASARSSVLADLADLHRRVMSADLDPAVGRHIAPLTARLRDDRYNPEAWAQVRAAFEANGGTPVWASTLIDDALGHIERWGAALGQTGETPVRAPMPLSFDHAIRFALRDVFIKNAREGGAWVAIPTGKLNDRIQANTYGSAAHFYDGQLKRALERIARDIDPSLQIEQTILPAPPLKRGVPVYIVKGITPETNARLLADGLPRYGAAARRADGGPMNDRARAQEVEALLRADERWGKTAAAMIDAGDLVLAPSREALPEHMRDIPQWVGAVADYTTGKTYFITRNLSDQQLRALLVHEVGVHQELKPMLGAKRYGAFLEYVRTRLVDAEQRFAANRASGGRAIRTDPWLEALDRVKGHHSQPYREALGLEGEHARAPDDPADLTDYELEEVAAHVAEALEMAHEHADAETRKALEPDLAWWQQILEAVRRWAATALGIGDLKGRDVHTLAVAALRRAGQRAEKAVGARREQPAPMVAVDSARILRFAKAKGFDGDDATAAARWLDAGGYFSPDGKPPARASVFFGIGGKLARTADHTALRRAMQMRQQGADTDAVRRRTGWYQGADEKWRFEFSDRDIRFKRAIKAGDAGVLGDFIAHPHLFQAYPELAQVRFEVVKALSGDQESDGRTVAHWAPRRGGWVESIQIAAKPDEQAMLSTLVHEVQHGIQAIETFYGSAFPPLAANDGAYWDRPHEREARDVSRRRMMDDQQRRNTPPEITLITRNKPGGLTLAEHLSALADVENEARGARRAAPSQKNKTRDYRMQNPDGSPKAGRRETNAAVGALATGAAALPAVGVAVAVNELEKGRQERKAEHDRLLAEEQAGAKRRATQSYNRAEQKRINGALETGAWQDLPEPKRPLRDMTLLERRAYVRQMADLAGRATGVPADLLFAKIARETAYSFLPDIESGSLDAADPNSRRAYGLGQFMPDTFSGELLRNGARLGFDAGGRTRKQLTSAADVQAMRGDPRFAVLMTAIHTRENIITLRDRLGRDPTRAEVYAAHFFGVDRAIEFRGDVDADLGADATQRKYRAEANANEQLFRPGGHKLSARQVFQNMQDEFGDEPVALGDGALFPDAPADPSSQGR